VQRYPDRVLLLATDRCAVYCRFCTRSRMVGSGDGAVPLEALAPAFAWCAARAAAADFAPWPGLVTIRLIAAWAILAVLTLVDTGNAAAAPPGRLVPLGLIGIGVAALVLPVARTRADSAVRVALAQSGGGRGAGGSTA